MPDSANSVNLEQQSIVKSNEISQTIDSDDLENNFIGSPSFDSGPEDEVLINEAKDLDRDANLSAADEINRVSLPGVFTQPTGRISDNKQDSLIFSKPRTPELLTGLSKDMADQISETPDSLPCFFENSGESTLQKVVSEISDTMVFPNGISTQEVQRLVHTNSGDDHSAINPSLTSAAKSHDISLSEKPQKKHQLKSNAEEVPPLPLIAKALARPHKLSIFQKELFIPRDDEAYTKVVEVYHKRSGLFVTKKPTSKGFNLISDELKSKLRYHQHYKAFRFHHVSLLFDSLGAKSQPSIDNYLIYDPESDSSPIKHVEINNDVVELQPSANPTTKNKKSLPEESVIINNEKVLLSKSIQRKALPQSAFSKSVSSKLNKSQPDNQTFESNNHLNASIVSSTNDQFIDAQGRFISQLNVEQPILTKDEMQTSNQSQGVSNIKEEIHTQKLLNLDQGEESYEHDQVIIHDSSVIASSKSNEKVGNDSPMEAQHSQEDMENSDQEPSKIISSIDSNGKFDELEYHNLTRNDYEKSSPFASSIVSPVQIPNPAGKQKPSFVGTKAKVIPLAAILPNPVTSEPFSNSKDTPRQQSTQSDSDDAFATAPNSPLLDQSPIKLPSLNSNQVGNANRFLTRVKPTSSSNSPILTTTENLSAENIVDKSKVSGSLTKKKKSGKSVQSTSTETNQDYGSQNTFIERTNPQAMIDESSSSRAKPTVASASRQISRKEKVSKKKSLRASLTSGDSSLGTENISSEAKKTRKKFKQLSKDAAEKEKQKPEQQPVISKRTADLQVNSKALSISRFKSQQPTEASESILSLIDHAPRSKITTESPYTMKEDLTIINAVSDSRYINGAIKIAYFNLLAQITFGSKRTGEGLRSRYRKALVKSKDKFYNLCKSQRVEPYLLDEFFTAYDNYVKELAVQKQSKESVPAGSTPNGHTNGGVRKGNFGPEEDVALLKYVMEHSNERVCGRALYKAFAVEHPWRSFESWRNRFTRHLRPYIENFAFKEHWHSIPTHILNFLQSDNFRDESEPQLRRNKRKSRSNRSTRRTTSEDTRSTSQAQGLSDDSMFQDNRPFKLGMEAQYDISDSDSDSVRTESNSDSPLIKRESSPFKKQKTRSQPNVVFISDSSASEENEDA